MKEKKKNKMNNNPRRKGQKKPEVMNKPQSQMKGQEHQLVESCQISPQKRMVQSPAQAEGPAINLE